MKLSAQPAVVAATAFVGAVGLVVIAGLVAGGGNVVLRDGATVVRVIDGDTLDVDFDGDRTRIRLLNADAPETKDPSRPVGCLGSFDPSAGTVAQTGDQVTWTVGTLAPGAVETLVYSVKVNSDAYDVTLRNAATASGDVPPATCPAPQPGAARVAAADDCETTHETPPKKAPPPPTQPSTQPPSQPPVAPPGGPDLPNTGANAALIPILVVGGLLIVGGAGSLIVVRRRHRV